MDTVTMEISTSNHVIDDRDEDEMTNDISAIVDNKAMESFTTRTTKTKISTTTNVDQVTSNDHHHGISIGAAIGGKHKFDVSKREEEHLAPPKKRIHDNKDEDSNDSQQESPNDDDEEEESPREHLLHLLLSSGGDLHHHPKDVGKCSSSSTIRNNLIIALAESGGIMEFHHVFEHLIQTNRVDIFALKLLLEFWSLFPESAEEDIFPSFILLENNGGWQQLLSLMQLSKKSSSKLLKKQVYHAVLTVMKKQWQKDLSTFERNYQEGEDVSYDDSKQNNRTETTELPKRRRRSSITSNNAPMITISSMAIWLPRERSKWDKELDFVRRFSRIVYPTQRLAAKSLYRKQVKSFCEIVNKRKEAEDDQQKHNNKKPDYQNAREPSEAIMQQLQEEESNRIPLTTRWKPPPKTNFPLSFPTLIRLPPARDQKKNGGLLSSATTTSNAAEDIVGGAYRNCLTLPRIGRIDHHFMTDKYLTQAGEQFLRKGTRHYASKTSEDRILYIHQGEVGHAIPDQCDVIVSDRATTCHLFAIRSESPLTCPNGRCCSNIPPPLTSLAHLDGPIYDDCVQSMIETHIAHHQMGSSGVTYNVDDQDSLNDEEKKSESCSNNRQQGVLDVQIHICGGFDDDRHSSQRISEWLLHLLAWLAEEYKDQIRMTLNTCVISTMNDTGSTAPVGRGMGIDLRTGEPFLAKVDSDACGPAQQIRNARIWSRGDGTLNEVHTATSNDFIIQPFFYQGSSRHDDYLRMPNEKMILRTSTSPDVEESDFCSSVRSTLRYMRTVDCTNVFGAELVMPLVFQRVGISNSWKRKK